MGGWGRALGLGRVSYYIIGGRGGGLRLVGGGGGGYSNIDLGGSMIIPGES